MGCTKAILERLADDANAKVEIIYGMSGVPTGYRIIKDFKSCIDAANWIKNASRRASE